MTNYVALLIAQFYNARMEGRLIICYVLWVIASGLIIAGIWKLVKAGQLLSKAKWSEYSTLYQGFLATAEKSEDFYLDMIKKYEEYIKRYEAIGDTEGISESTTTLVELNKSLKESRSYIKDVQGMLLRYSKKEGVGGLGTIRQIEATKEIAMAAAYFTGATVLLAISGILIAFLRGS